MYALWVIEDGRYAFSLEDNGGLEISAEHHQAMLNGEIEGKRIAPDEDGKPVLIDLPPPRAGLQASRGRRWRDAEIESVKWLLERHRDEVDMQRRTTLSASQSAELLEYVQRLRDWPADADFPSVERRPPRPQWLTSAKK